jgi:hypothetical protein
MIRQILHQLDTLKQTNQASWRQLCGLVSCASVMRWRKRQRLGLPLWQCPGPKKSLPLDWSEFYPLLRQLIHGRVRTQGTGELYERFARFLSRRQLRCSSNATMARPLIISMWMPSWPASACCH